jgi:hypothetical protein
MRANRGALRAARCGLPAAALVSALSLAGSAQAFCRTTTSSAPPIAYDPAVAGQCWNGGDAGPGIPIAWPARARVGYSLASNASTQVTLDQATAAAHAAFDAWAGNDDAGAPLCPGGAPNVQAYDVGPLPPSVVATDCGLVTCAPTVHDTKHIIVFRDTYWPYTDPTQTLALTTVTYGVNSGTIYDADTEINTFGHKITVQEPPPPGDTFDLQSILTHEAGHFLGLAHAIDTSAVMYAYYHAGSTTLQPDDVAGICTIYPPLGPAGGHSCALVAAKPKAVWGLPLCFATLALSRMWRRSRKRAGTRGRANQSQ